MNFKSGSFWNWVAKNIRLKYIVLPNIVNFKGRVRVIDVLGFEVKLFVKMRILVLRNIFINNKFFT